MNLTLDTNRCIISGSVTIEGVEHLVQAKYVKCDATLNRKAWNTTEKKSRCPKCFNSEGNRQLKLFNTCE